LYKRVKVALYSKTEFLGDRAYQGIQQQHAKSRTPKRKPHKQPLSKADKASNSELARLRIVIEHVIRRLKVFRILKETYRNKRKRFGLRINLIAAIYNLDWLGMAA
jgi:DDE superfamily endonuclease